MRREVPLLRLVWLAGRMRGLWAGAVTAALLCAGCSGDDEPVEVTTTDSAGRTTVITQEATEEPTATEQGDIAQTTAAMVSTLLEGPGTSVEIDLPEGWTVQELGEAERTLPPDPTDQAPQQWCLVPPSAPPAIDGCSGVLVAVGPDWLPGHAGAAYSLRQVEGWRSTPGALACPVDEDGEPTDAAVVTATPDDEAADDEAADGEAGDEAANDDNAQDGVADDGLTGDGAEATAPPPTPDDSEVDLLVTASEGMPLTSVESEVAGRTVTYETWRATCSLSEGVVISPQVWHDRDLNVLVRDYFGLPTTIAIVESLRAA